MQHKIFGIHITKRTESVPAVQACLTKYGCNIRARLGLHDIGCDTCSSSGLVLVDAVGDEAEAFYAELQTLKGVDVQRMDFAD